MILEPPLYQHLHFHSRRHHCLLDLRTQLRPPTLLHSCTMQLWVPSRSHHELPRPPECIPLLRLTVRHTSIPATPTQPHLGIRLLCTPLVLQHLHLQFSTRFPIPIAPIIHVATPFRRSPFAVCTSSTHTTPGRISRYATKLRVSPSTSSAPVPLTASPGASRCRFTRSC